MRRGFKAWAEQEAIEQRRHLGLSANEPLPALQCANSVTAIIHNTGHARTRQESNLMHEMAHIICKHEPSVLTSVGGLSFLLREYNADQEEEASWLGACLQIPRSALWWAVKRRMTIDEMVQYFQASEELIRFRRQMTGIDRQLSRLPAR